MGSSFGQKRCGSKRTATVAKFHTPLSLLRTFIVRPVHSVQVSVWLLAAHISDGVWMSSPDQNLSKALAELVEQAARIELRPRLQTAVK